MPGPAHALAAVLAASLLGPGAARADTPPAQPNLEARALTADATGVAGGALTLSAEVVPTGATVPQFYWSAYLTQGVVEDGILLGTFGPVQLAPGRTEQLTEQVTLPAGLTGSYLVAVVLDPDGLVTEPNEADNVAVADRSTRIRAPSANIAVRSVRATPDGRREGEAVAIDYVLENTGETAATVLVAAHLTPNATLSSDDPEIARATVTVAAGQLARGTLTGAVPAGSPTGDYRVGVIVDPTFALDEISELDNLGVAPRPLNVYRDAVQLLTESLPGGTVFIRYSMLLAASGGDGHYRFQVKSGRLPRGLSLGAAGLISGSPDESGEREVEIEVESRGLREARRFRIDVALSGLDLTIATPSLVPGTVSIPYETFLVVGGGEPPYQWSTRDAAPLPGGLDLSSSGRLSGIPTVQGTYTFAVQVEDSLGARDAREFTVEISAPNVVALSEHLAPVPVGEPMDYTLKASGGRPRYSWIALSSPPPGLTVTENGHLIGTPSQLGTYAVRVRATDASAAHAQDSALIHVTVEEKGAFQIVVDEIPTVLVRERLSFVLEAAGGVEPLSWRLVAGEALPAGFVLKSGEMAGMPARNAVVVGTSVRPLTHAFSVQVEDAEGRRREISLSLHVVRFVDATDAGGCRCVAPVASVPGASLGLLAGALILAVRRLRRPLTRST